VVIFTAFPQFRGRCVAFLAEGWDFQVFEVGAEWLFRFPKREESATRLTKEYHLLSDLVQWVSLPIPNYRYFCESHGDSGWPLAGYDKIPGTPADVTEAIDWPTVARQLGIFLGELHTYPVGRALEAGVPREKRSPAQWRDRALASLDGIANLPVDQRDLREYLSDLPKCTSGTPRLVHNDLWAEHILIDPHTLGVSGVIDWGDAAIGDPAIDLALVYAWRGEQGLREVVAHYPVTLTPCIVDRVRYLATCLAIRNLELGQYMEHPRWVEAGRKALRWTFAT
jgi:aminoglycoside phosphotransferase (APT) family kinase protein